LKMVAGVNNIIKDGSKMEACVHNIRKDGGETQLKMAAGVYLVRVA